MPSVIRKELNQITQRIIERSQLTRVNYLNRMSHATEVGRARAKLSCGNVAHGMAACGDVEKERLGAAKVANLAIINSYNDMLSAHQPYERFPKIIKQAAIRFGATAQVAGGVPAMCDGVTQGQIGMELSLFSRDLIAMATAVSLSHNMFDGVLCLGVCDKIVPGLLIGALSFGHLPCAFLPAGPMPTGQGNSEKAKTRQAYAEGLIDRQTLLASESASYHSAGTCTFYGTANSNQMLMEIMGLHLPGSSFVPPNTELRDALTEKAVENIIGQLNYGQPLMPLCEIISEKSIVNGMVGLLATGGSTNHAIHLVAIAKAAGIIIDWQDMAELSQVIPLLCNIYPNGNADINHFHAAGGMGYLMRELSKNGYLHQDVKTLMGEGLQAYFKEPKLSDNPSAEIYRQNRELTPKINVVSWIESAAVSQDESVLSSADNAFCQQGGLKLLVGNLGRSVIKTSAVKEIFRVIEAPALVFDSQEEFRNSFDEGLLERDFVAVLRFQGPRCNGMPELHKLTPILGILQDRGFQVALITDGRMSGASGRIPTAIHLSPEAADNGPIGKIIAGDLIRLDSNLGELDVLVEQTEFEQRTCAKAMEITNTFGVGRELFESFRNMVCSAEQGASIF